MAIRTESNIFSCYDTKSTQRSDVLHEQTHNNSRTHTPSVYCQQQRPRRAQSLQGASGTEATLINKIDERSGGIHTNGCRARAMDPLQRAGLSAARCHVHSLRCPPSRRWQPRERPKPRASPLRCTAFVNSPAQRVDGTGRRVARYSSSLVALAADGC